MPPCITSIVLFGHNNGVNRGDSIMMTISKPITFFTASNVKVIIRLDSLL